jgi:hypothetical protein
VRVEGLAGRRGCTGARVRQGTHLSLDPARSERDRAEAGRSRGARLSRGRSGLLPRLAGVVAPAGGGAALPRPPTRIVGTSRRYPNGASAMVGELCCRPGLVAGLDRAIEGVAGLRPSCSPAAAPWTTRRTCAAIGPAPSFAPCR